MRLALIRKAGAVIRRACNPPPPPPLGAGYPAMGPRTLVIQPIDFRTLLLYYTVAVAIAADRREGRGAEK